MVILTKEPPAIHSVYGPIVFEFRNIFRSLITESIFLVNPNNGRSIEIELEFFQQKARLDFRGYLRQLFTPQQCEVQVNKPVINEEYQSFQYQIWLDKDGIDRSVMYTALRSAVQLHETTDWLSIGNQLLTGFKTWKVYPDYPSDISAMAAGKGAWKNTNLAPYRINRMLVDCSTDSVEISSDFECTLEWTDFICRPNQTGIATQLVYSTLKNKKQVAQIHYNLLSDFGIYSGLDNMGYLQLLDHEIEQRAAALLALAQATASQCENVTLKNTVISNNCNNNEEEEEMVGQIIDYAGVEGTWPKNWLLCNGQKLKVRDYPELAAALQHTYNPSDAGSDSFTLPDLKQRFIAGWDDTKDIYGKEKYPLGKIGGENEHVLTKAEMPSHNHYVRKAKDGSADTGRSYDNSVGSYDDASKGSLDNKGLNAVTDTVGGNNSHENRPPFMALYKLICASAKAFPNK